MIRKLKQAITVTAFVVILAGLALSSTSVLILPAHAVAVEEGYACGTYNAGDYGANCDTTTSSDSARPVTESVEQSGDDTSDIAIVLEDYVEYSKATGVTLELIQGQILSFRVSGETHTITIKEITDTYIIVTIASDPVDVKIAVNETIGHDVDGDGKDDIILSYLGKASEVASLRLAQAYIDESRSGTSSTIDQPVTEKANSWLPWFAIAAALIVLVTIITTIILRRR